jgi:hypothetical protein
MRSAASPIGTGEPDNFETSVASPRSCPNPRKTRALFLNKLFRGDTHYVTDLDHQCRGKAIVEVTLARW